MIVAQPASLCHEGAGLLQVGVLRWMLPPREVVVDGTGLTMAAEPAMTFVVKATFSYAACASPDDEMTLSTEPDGLALDVPSELPGAEEDEIAYPSDFVPLKRMCDLLVTGHACASRPATRLVAGFGLGAVSRAFVVESRMPAARVPLVRAALRARDGASPAEPVGPSRTSPFPEEHGLGFDFTAYNTAPASQQQADIPRGATLSLSGLSERAETLSLKLPAVAPVLWVDTTEERGIPLALDCDTLWVDTDRELLVMVYRALMQVPSLDLDGVVQVTLGLARDDVPPTLDEVQRDLERGVFEAAIELQDFDDEAAPAPELSMFAKYAVWERPVAPSISLATYALISAALAEGSGPRHEILRAHGFDEDGFLLEERGWLTAMSEAAVKGDTEPATRYGELFVEAQDGLAGPNEGKESLEAYVALKVSVEDAADPTAALAERQMTLAAWMRMDRRWMRRALADAALDAEITQRARTLRARHQGGEEG
ncbi:Hypothetical protein CAP_1942 [Chondromyces apiculatus DSM 436]|uniref:DUF2169 domain-containing protein n=1 Tax=Chondromyces apiculatus DSM 436 TaxID=1192034 RepID=A0A017TBW7_9BACT|nr:Hypothetical protein CAP_1942 [Chondromyces apiculatus DSM 436]